jgi:hypothetical protein
MQKETSAHRTKAIPSYRDHPILPSIRRRKSIQTFEGFENEEKRERFGRHDREKRMVD